MSNCSAMPFVVIWDAETDCTFHSLGDLPRDQAMRMMQATVICAVVVDSKLASVPGGWEEAQKTAREHFWWRDVAKKGKDPFDELLALFDDAEAIVAYNGLGFDFPVLRKHYGGSKKAAQRYMTHRLKTHDPMLNIAKATDQPFVGLNKLLQWNRLEPKTSDGLEAIRMWNSGRREELLSYCMHDVRQLAQVVHLSRVHIQGVGHLPNQVTGIASYIRMQRVLQPVCFEDEFVLVAPASVASAWPLHGQS